MGFWWRMIKTRLKPGPSIFKKTAASKVDTWTYCIEINRDAIGKGDGVVAVPVAALVRAPVGLAAHIDLREGHLVLGILRLRPQAQVVLGWVGDLVMLRPGFQFTLNNIQGFKSKSPPIQTKQRIT